MMKSFNARLDRFDGMRSEREPSKDFRAFERIIDSARQQRSQRTESSERIGRRNVYRCGVCRGSICTVDEAAGVTPFMIGCRVRRGCTGHMQSAFYAVDQFRVPTHAWRKRKRETGDETLAIHELTPDERIRYFAEKAGE